MRIVGFLFLAAWFLGACAQPEDPGKPLMTKTTNGTMVLYAPSRFAVSATGSTGWSVRGFRLEDPQRESLAAIVETTARQLGIPENSPLGFTSPVFAQSALDTVLTRVKKNIPGLLPQASPFEEEGDWSISPVESGTFRDAHGNLAIMARYRFSYVPVYQLRSVDVFHYLARVVVGQGWRSYPQNQSRYFPAGRNIMYFSIGIVFYEEDGFYTSQKTSRKVGVSFYAAPDNKSSQLTWDDLDDLLTFKTFGNIRDQLVTDGQTVVVPEAGNAVDLLVAIDRGGNMVEEASMVKGLVTELIGRVATESDYAYRIAFLTQGSTDVRQLADGSLFLSPDTAEPGVLADGLLDEILATADGNTSVPANLLRTAALAMTGETLSGVNGSFRRPQAPLLLITISDREDESPRTDGTNLLRQDFAAYYADALAYYDHWIALAPRSQGCTAGGIFANSAAAELLKANALTAGDAYNLCGFSRVDFQDRVLTWAATESSLFKFEAPQPFPFTLSLTVNGKTMRRGADADFSYDVFGDHLVFQSSIAPQAGDVVRVKFQRFEPFRTPSKN